MKEYLVKWGEKVKLAAWDADDTGIFKATSSRQDWRAAIAFVIPNDRRKRGISCGDEEDPLLWWWRRLWDLRDGRVPRLVALKRGS